jgi:4-amino-4-deoxy-L-arabinose transferase-like glycosyltransferase
MSERRFWSLLAVALAGGFVVRFLFLHDWRPVQLEVNDGLYYHLQANLLAEGKGFIDPITYLFHGVEVQSASHPPLFPVLLAGVSWLGGTTTLWHQAAQVSMGGIAVGVIGLLGREVAGARVGLLAALLAALYPLFWATGGDMYAEPLYVLLVACMLLLAYRCLRTATWPWAGALGVAAGAAALTRGEGLLFVVVLVGPVALVARPERGGRLLLPLAALAGVVLVIAPWTAFNLTRLDEPVPITTNFGAVLAGSNCPTTYRGGVQLGSWDIQCTAHHGPGDESVQSTRLRQRGTDYALDHLGRVPVVVAARLGRTLDLYRIGPPDLAPRWIRVLTVAAWYALVPISIVGAFVLRRRRIRIWPLLMMLVAVLPTVALTWGSPRFRLPIDVALVVLAAAAIDAFLLRLAGRRFRDRTDTPVAATA